MRCEVDFLSLPRPGWRLRDWHGLVSSVREVGRTSREPRVPAVPVISPVHPPVHTQFKTPYCGTELRPRTVGQTKLSPRALNLVVSRHPSTGVEFYNKLYVRVILPRRRSCHDHP